MIKLVRVDHRLLHGQVAMAWTQSLDVDCMLIANDAIMKDEIRKTTLKLAKPNGVKLVMKNIEDSITALHVDLSQCIFHEDSTTKKCDVNVYDGERDYIRADEGKNWAHTTRIRDCDVDYLRDFDVVHTSCNAKLHEDVHKLQDLAAMVTFDFSVKDKYRTHEFLELTCPYLELGQFSCEHMETDAIRELMQKVYGHGCRNVVATMGERGQMFYNGREFVEGKARYVKALDTMGAGDSFIAAVIVSLLNQGWRKGTTLTGDAVRQALQDGASYSAKNCLRGGGFGFRNLIEE
jgi:fructoselysine 6-kinase|nr:PfkB family carbohydrate kinase [uncultured Lachnoclostridium sp.]